MPPKPGAKAKDAQDIVSASLGGTGAACDSNEPTSATAEDILELVKFNRSHA